MKNYLLHYMSNNKLWYIAINAKDIFAAIKILDEEVKWAVITYVYCEDTVPTFSKDLFPKD